MIVNIGEQIEFGGAKFIIVKVNRDDNMDGKVLCITGFDPDMANKEQQKQIKTDQIQETLVDTLNKLLKKGGEGGFGINLGG